MGSGVSDKVTSVVRPATSSVRVSVYRGTAPSSLPWPLGLTENSAGTQT